MRGQMVGRFISEPAATFYYYTSLTGQNRLAYVKSSEVRMNKTWVPGWAMFLKRCVNYRSYIGTVQLDHFLFVEVVLSTSNE